MTPRTVWRKFQGEWLYLTFLPDDRLGSGMATRRMMTNAMANTAMAMKSSGRTSVMDVAAVTWPMSMPTNRGVRVPASELHEPPIWMSWLPLLPPPPRRLSMGLTTVLSMHTEKPQTKAPSR